MSVAGTERVPSIDDDIEIASAQLPTRFGQFRMYGFRYRGIEAAALVAGEPAAATAPLARIHSQCITGESFGSLRCDCGLQLEAALRLIQQEGCGIVTYLLQEGRGIGLFNKIRVYDLQDEGLDTVDANLHLGFAPDLREYHLASLILRRLGIYRIRLMSGNPQKLRKLVASGITVVSRVTLKIERHRLMNSYLETKRERMGHLS
jgi:3,4-dihydroxy 2-butanone 4-phosphate synthase/GTP cyclohydrolase II